MQIIQFPILINNNTMTTNAMSINVNTSKETVNTTYIKSILAQHIINKNTYAALHFYTVGTIKFNHKVLQHIRKFVQQFPDSQFKGNMQLHYYILNLQKPQKLINMVIYGVSFTDNNNVMVLNRSNTVINTPTISLNDVCNTLTNRKIDMNIQSNFTKYMEIYMNTMSLYYMPNLQRVIDYSISTTYKGRQQTVLYFADGTHKLFENVANEQILTLFNTYA